MMQFSEEIKNNIRTLLKDNIEADVEETRLDRFKDIKEKGWPKKGSYGKVYKMQRSGDRGTEDLAIKIIELDIKTDYTDSEIGRNADSVRQDTVSTYNFLMACQEAVLQSSASFRHTNIVRCYESWITPPKVDNVDLWLKAVDPEMLIGFVENEELTKEIRNCLTAAKGMKFIIVMDLYEQDLATRYYKTEAPPTTEETMSILLQTTEALAFIHAKGYEHKDLKLNNIMMTTDPNYIEKPDVAVGDFGLCGRVEAHQAPDDIWSMGSIMFELSYIPITTPCPTEEQIGDILNELQFSAFEGPTNLKAFVEAKLGPNDINKLIVECLDEDKKQRITSKDLLVKLTPSPEEEL